MTTATLPGTELARVLANAGAFVPAKAITQMLALRLSDGRVEARGSDGYAAGIDYAPAALTGPSVAVALTRDDMGTIESKARAGKTNNVTLTVEAHSVTLTLWGQQKSQAKANPQEPQAAVQVPQEQALWPSSPQAPAEAQEPESELAAETETMVEVEATEYPLAPWAQLEELLARSRPEARPEFVAFDPLLFARFAKVRAMPDRVMDLWFDSAESPVLVKIGPTFQGLVMPLQRERAEAYTPEGLW